MLLWILTGLAGMGAVPEGQVIDSFDYRTAAAARQVWRDHADQGTSHAGRCGGGCGRPVLELAGAVRRPTGAQSRLH